MGHGAGQTALPKGCGWITRRGPVDTGGRPGSGSARWKTGAEPKKTGSRRTIRSRVIGDQSRNRVAFPRVSLPMASRIHKNRDKSILIADGRNRNGRSSAAFLFYQNRRIVRYPFISSPSPIRLYDRWESRTGFVIPGKTL